MRRSLLLLVVVLIASVVFAVPGAGPALARSSEEPAVTTTTAAPPAPNIIPRPNEGAEPQDAGDRGGALQTVLFFVIVATTVGIGAMIVRQSRRARAERGF